MQEKLRAQAMAEAEKEEGKGQAPAKKEEEGKEKAPPAEEDKAEKSAPEEPPEPSPEDLEEEMEEDKESVALSEKDQKLYDKLVTEEAEKGSAKAKVQEGLKKLKEMVPDEVMKPLQRYMLKRELKEYDKEYAAQQEAVEKDLQEMKDEFDAGMKEALEKAGIDVETADLETVKNHFENAKVRKEFAEAFVEDAPPAVKKLGPPSFLGFMVVHMLESMMEWAGKPEGYESAMDKRKRYQEYSKGFDAAKAEASSAEGELTAATEKLKALGDRPALGREPDKRESPDAHKEWLAAQKQQKEWDAQKNEVLEKKKALNGHMQKMIHLTEDQKLGPGEDQEARRKERDAEAQAQEKSKKETKLPFDSVEDLLRDLEEARAEFERAEEEGGEDEAAEKPKSKPKSKNDGKPKPKPRKPKEDLQSSPEKIPEKEENLGGAPSAEPAAAEAPVVVEDLEKKPTPAEKEEQKRERARQKARAKRVIKKHDLKQDDIDAVRKFKSTLDAEAEEEEESTGRAKGKSKDKGEEKPKGEKKPKPPQTDAQKMQEFMRGADPDMKKRMQKMSPKEFMQMLAAITDEDQVKETIRLGRHLESEWIRWAEGESVEDESAEGNADADAPESGTGLSQFFDEITQGLKDPSDEVLAKTFESMAEEADNQKKASFERLWFRLGASPLTAEGYFFDNPEHREVRQFARSHALHNLTPKERSKGAPPTMVEIDKKHPGSESVSTLSRYIVDTEEPAGGVPHGREELPKHPRLPTRRPRPGRT